MIRKTIISDTSCLIALERINQLEIIHLLFSTIITTPEVATEYGRTLPNWISTVEVIHKNKIKELEIIVDNGEASAIALAIETKDSLLIIDEKKGRQLAADLKLETIGTLRILLLAKQKGIIHSVKDLIIALEKASFRFSKNIILEILTLAGEQ